MLKYRFCTFGTGLIMTLTRIFDSDTKQTSVVLTETKPLPPPLTPAQ